VEPNGKTAVERGQPAIRIPDPSGVCAAGKLTTAAKSITTGHVLASPLKLAEALIEDFEKWAQRTIFYWSGVVSSFKIEQLFLSGECSLEAISGPID
jgi:hypothetical protein